MRSPAEMNELFKHWPQAMENAARIGELCNVDLRARQEHLPAQVQGARGRRRSESYVAELAAAGARARASRRSPGWRPGKPFDADLYATRLQLELGVIQKMGFSGYFLIVWDFIN